MPTYDYRCRNCSHAFEEFQPITAEPLVQCPVCHMPGLYRVIGKGAGMIFKGSGFYLTDYKKGGGAKEESGSDSTKKKGGGTDAAAGPEKKTPGSDKND